ncbi:hypothetical protein PR003_g31916 [Phytophthora rubi]|uniref:RxLR effector protein n=1 Tax=Phytophthora rubi TaxID=129364 RepID=A0A6A4B4X5_9STRA|nr:hypothetical protein PR001_g29231 [Phytophthora rubi]KAE8970305.1 hypothetical protein PR002_g27159 [Phytophthora rubi]KAE9267048.1 hypothetical protein PR003_g31916 [Phytophthora rubi]
MGCLLIVGIFFVLSQCGGTTRSSGSTTANGSNMPAGVKVSLAALAACVCCLLTL